MTDIDGLISVLFYLFLMVEIARALKPKDKKSE